MDNGDPLDSSLFTFDSSTGTLQVLTGDPSHVATHDLKLFVNFAGDWYT